MNIPSILYLSGPMSGYPDFNHPAFNRAAAEWRKEGWVVFNPAENFGGRTDLTRPEYMRVDIQQVMQSDAIALLPGWQRSQGAQCEVSVAKQLGLLILDAGTFGPYQETGLQEAERLVYGDRQGSYGHPLDDYLCTAALWSEILKPNLHKPISAEQAILCMIGVKVSRLSRHITHRDSAVDVEGYAECLLRVVQERIARETERKENA